MFEPLRKSFDFTTPPRPKAHRQPTRYIAHLRCGACGSRFLSAMPLLMPQRCLDCGSPLSQCCAWDTTATSAPPCRTWGNGGKP